MTRRLDTAVPVLAILFLSGWLASLAFAPACTSPPPKFDVNLIWAALIGPFVLWSLMVRLWRLAHPTSTWPLEQRWPVVTAALLLLGTFGCALSLGCAPLEAHWPTWEAHDLYRQFLGWPSKWKLAGMTGMGLGLLGLVVCRFTLTETSETTVSPAHRTARVVFSFLAVLLLVGAFAHRTHRPITTVPASAAPRAASSPSSSGPGCIHCRLSPRVPEPPEAQGLPRFWQFEPANASQMSRTHFFTVVAYKQGGVMRCVVQLLKSGSESPTALTDAVTMGPTPLGRQVTSACAVRSVELGSAGYANGGDTVTWNEAVASAKAASTFEVSYLRKGAREDVVEVVERRAPGAPFVEDLALMGNYALRSMGEPKNVEERWWNLHPETLKAAITALHAQTEAQGKVSSAKN